ncbi:MAG: GNAT family N-acetyltransferase, partial [Phycisphaerales bacterium]
ELLMHLSAIACDLLVSRGHRAVAIQPTTENLDAETLATELPHKTVALRSGLGWIGKSALLITEDYGPAVRLATVLCDAEFETAKPTDTSRCGDCRECVDYCPAKAISGLNWQSGMSREGIYDAFACRETARRLAARIGVESTICGICISVCPWTQRYIRRELAVRPSAEALQIIEVDTGEDLEIVRDLFDEYADSLGFDLGFQDFERELTGLPGDYARPKGCLLLARYQGQPAGCVALRPFDNNVCEMKRLYVRPELRHMGIGRNLATAVIDLARKIGYTAMRLDTVPSMKAARALYESFAFQRIGPYRGNPIEGAIFMELNLA